MNADAAKPYVSAAQAAKELGVPVQAVLDDIRSAHYLALAGGSFGDAVIVHAYELQEPRASMHRRRLARASETGCAAHTENNQ